MEEMAPVIFHYSRHVLFFFLKNASTISADKAISPNAPLQVHNSVGLWDPRTEDVMCDKYIYTMTSQVSFHRWLVLRCLPG